MVKTKQLFFCPWIEYFHLLCGMACWGGMPWPLYVGCCGKLFVGPGGACGGGPSVVGAAVGPLPPIIPCWWPGTPWGG